MNGHNREKRELERVAIHTFLRLYNGRYGERLRLLYQQEKPDAVLEDTRTRRKLGMEITHLFYNNSEAKRLLGRADTEVREPESFDVLLRELNVLIARKEQKFDGYVKDYPISLLIRNASPLFGLSHFLRHADGIYRPRDVFQDIWFLTRDGTPEWHLIGLPERST